MESLRAYLRPLDRIAIAAAALPRRFLFIVVTVGLMSRETLVLALVLVAGGAAALAAALVLDLVLLAGADVFAAALVAASLRCLRLRRLFSTG